MIVGDFVAAVVMLVLARVAVIAMVVLMFVGVAIVGMVVLVLAGMSVVTVMVHMDAAVPVVAVVMVVVVAVLASGQRGRKTCYCQACRGKSGCDCLVESSHDRVLPCKGVVRL